MSSLLWNYLFTTIIFLFFLFLGIKFISSLLKRELPDIYNALFVLLVFGFYHLVLSDFDERVIFYNQIIEIKYEDVEKIDVFIYETWRTLTEEDIKDFISKIRYIEDDFGWSLKVKSKTYVDIYFKNKDIIRIKVINTSNQGVVVNPLFNGRSIGDYRNDKLESCNYLF